MKDGEGIAVIGAGAGGMATAISAARQGVNVFLLEKTARLGGTVTQSLIHTLGGIYDSSGEYINGGISMELACRLLKETELTHMRKIGRTWTLTVSPGVYEKVIEAWISEESNIKVLRECKVTHVETDSGSIQGINVETPYQTITLKPTVLIDATGTAEIVRMIDPALIMDELDQAAGGLIFQMQGVKPGSIKFPKNIGLIRTIRQAAQNGLLPHEIAFIWIDAGLYEDEAYFKLFIPFEAKSCNQEVLRNMTRNAEKMRDELVSFLTNMPIYAEAKITCTGKLGIRDGGRIKGEYCLTKADVSNSYKFSDVACRCCWPIEYWDPKTGVTLEYLPDNTFYEIPLSSLKVRGMNNLWVAGKCLSAEKLVQASARVVGTCWSMGEAVGKAVSANQ